MEDKIKCSQCGSEYNKQILIEKQGTNDIVCPLCSEPFSDKVTCPKCGSSFEKSMIKEKEIENCPACVERLSGKEVKIRVSKTWEMIDDLRFIEKTGKIPLRCLKCESSAHVDKDKFEILTPEQCKLNAGITIRCNEQDECKNPLTSDFLVLAEEKEELETYSLTCPTCGSPNVKKIKLGSKIVAVGLLDYLSIGYIGKTFQCQNCKYTW